MFRTNIVSLLLLVFITTTVVEAQENLTQFGKGQELTSVQVGVLFSDIYENANSDFKKYFFKIISEQYQFEGCSNPIFYEVTEIGRMGFAADREINQRLFVVVFPPHTKWRYFDPNNGVKQIEISGMPGKEVLFADLSGWYLTFTQNVANSDFSIVKYNNAN